MNQSAESQLCLLDKQLLDHYQRGLPKGPRPYLDMANRLDVSESQVLASLQRMSDLGVLSRVGAVFNHKKAGASTLAAFSVPTERLETVAELVNSFAEVNHNYLREHEYNLWFVVTAADQPHLQATLAELEEAVALPLLDLPMEQAYHIDLGFKLQWN